MKAATILGTRPEIIKLSTLIPLLEKKFEHFIIHTGQHYDYEMDAAFFQELGLPQPKYNLHVSSGMQGKQTALMLEKIESLLVEEKPDFVVVQGDTNTTLAGALAAAKLHLPIVHVEAGARNFNKDSPEEINRIVADHVADILFTVDNAGSRNLKNEGIPADKIVQVGNTAYDACLRNLAYAEKSTLMQDLGLDKGKFILATIHRAESTDHVESLSAIVDALNKLSEKAAIVIPLHPRTKKKMSEYSLSFSPSIKVLPPQNYLDFLALISSCRFCISDSGGIQDEAIVCNVPCVIPLNETCWPQLVEAGKNILAGNTVLGIVLKSEELLNDKNLERIKSINYPYPRNVAERIVEVLRSGVKL